MTTPSTTSTETGSTFESFNLDDLANKATKAFEEIGDIDMVDPSEDPTEEEFPLDDGGEQGGGDDAEDDAEGSEAEDDSKDEKPKGQVALGSKERPYSAKSLPDGYVTLKIDGENETVSLKDLASGYMREQVFHRRVNTLNDTAKKATRVAEEAIARQNEVESVLERAKAGVENLFKNPRKLFELLDSEHEETLDALARMHVARVVEWQKNPGTREAYLQAKYRKQIAERDERERQRHEEEAKTRRATESQRRYLAEFEPGFKEGMKAAGFPKVTDEFKSTVLGLIEAHRRTKQPVTRDVVKAAVIRAAKLTKAETVEQRKPAPRATPAPVTRKSKEPDGPMSFDDMFRTLPDRAMKRFR